MATEFWKYLLSNKEADVFGTDSKEVADAAVARGYELIAGTKDRPEVDTTGWEELTAKAA